MVDYIHVSVELFGCTSESKQYDAGRSEDGFKSLLLTELRKRFPEADATVNFGATDFGKYAFVAVETTRSDRSKVERDVTELVEGLREDRFAEWVVPANLSE